MLIIPTNKDIVLEVNGNRIGVAQSYSAERSKNKPTFVITLNCVNFTSEIDMRDLPIFNVIIHKHDCRIIFSGCEWVKIEEGSQSENVIESLIAVASKRLEIA